MNRLIRKTNIFLLNFVEDTFEAKNMHENNKVDLAYFFGGDLEVVKWVNGRHKNHVSTKSDL